MFRLCEVCTKNDYSVFLTCKKIRIYCNLDGKIKYAIITLFPAIWKTSGKIWNFRLKVVLFLAGHLITNGPKSLTTKCNAIYVFYIIVYHTRTFHCLIVSLLMVDYGVPC